MFDIKMAPVQENPSWKLCRHRNQPSSLIEYCINEHDLPNCKATDELLTKELDEKTFSLLETARSDVLLRSNSKLSRKRRIYSHVHQDPKKSGRRFRANDRERRRMESLNGALDALKGCIPVPKGKKRMTKLHVLRLACNYIKALSELLEAAASKIPHKQAALLESKDMRINGLSIAQRYNLWSQSSRLYQHKET